MHNLEFWLPWTHLPNSQQLDEKVLGEPREQHLADQEHVASQSALQHDRHVAGVEQLDWVSTSNASVLGRLDGDLESEPLEVDDGGKDERSGQEVHNVGQPLSVESFLQPSSLVVPSEHDVEERNDGTLEFRTSTSVDGSRRKGLPDDGLADVGRDEQVDSGSETVSLGQKLVKEQDDRGSGDKLEDEEEDDSGSEGRRRAVETRENPNGSLTKGDDQGEDYERGIPTVQSSSFPPDRRPSSFNSRF